MYGYYSSRKTLLTAKIAFSLFRNNIFKKIIFYQYTYISDSDLSANLPMSVLWSDGIATNILLTHWTLLLGNQGIGTCTYV